MKRTVSIFLMALMILPLLFSCAANKGKSPTQSTQGDTTGPVETEPEDNYVETEEGAVLRIFVDRKEIKKQENSRPYDAAKEDISLILVIGQSNFTHMAGFAWEYSHYYIKQISPVVPTDPTLPAPGTAYSFNRNTSIFKLNEAHDMSYLSSPERKTSCIGGVTPAFAKRWNELTGTKVVFIQAAVEATGIHEWVADPQNYKCNCDNYGGGTCFSLAAMTYKTAYMSLSHDYNIVHTGYIFNQGEHDEKKRQGATVNDDQSYYDAYKSMHESFTSLLDLDFGGISVVRANAAGDTKEASTSYTKARYAQYKLCNDIDNLYMLSTVSETCSRDMMDQGNTVHYSQKVFNDMGTDMANNLYSRLGLGETNAYDGIKIYAKSGELLTHIGADGTLLAGTDELTSKNTDSRILIRSSALGRDDAISYRLFVDGVDYSKYIDGFGKITWGSFKSATGKDTIKVLVTVR